MNISMNKMLAIGFGGFIRAALRYAITCAASESFGIFPAGTLIVNAAGGFIMGFIMEASSVFPISEIVRVFLTTGILGGLTTFSTFSYETISFLSDGKYLMGGLNAGLNLFFALCGCWAGKLIAQLLW